MAVPLRPQKAREPCRTSCIGAHRIDAQLSLLFQAHEDALMWVCSPLLIGRAQACQEVCLRQHCQLLDADCRPVMHLSKSARCCMPCCPVSAGQMQA